VVSFWILSCFRARRGRSREVTGETSRTAPESRHPGSERRGGRPLTPARHRRAPGHLGQPRGPRAVARRPRTGLVGVVAVRSARTPSRGSVRPPLRHRRDACGVEPSLGCAAAERHAVRAALLVKHAVSLAGIYATSCPHRFGFVVIDAARLLDCSRLCESKLSRQRRCSATLRLDRFTLKLDQRTRHGPHRCALSLKPPAVERSSVAHTTLGWHCCSPERRGPEGTQVTRAVEKWSQDSLSLLVCAAGHLWPPRAARHVVHAPRVRRPSPLKAREAVQG
jgi:hypothetical protein